MSRRALGTFVREWREMYRATMDVHARDALHERRWDPVRSRRARLAAVAIGALLTLAVTPAFLLSTTAGIVATLGIAGCWLVLRRSLRELGDLPERVLDERQVAQRNRAYRIAWRIFMGGFTTALAACAGFMYAVSEWGSRDLTFPLELGLGLVAALAGVAAILPYAVLAWLEPGEHAEREPAGLRAVD